MVVCSNCQHENDENLKFCENCGAKLTRSCPNCGNPVALAAKFCGNCGFQLQTEVDPQVARLKKLVPKELAERLLSSKHGKIERERRVVTILFSDVKGSTALGEERDPEEVLEIMNGAFEVLIEPIYRYEGTLARLMGDAILAFFGAPIAHEDDPVRAALAALAIQAGMPEYAAQVEKKYNAKGFSVRVGINTGLVVVGEVGSDLRVEYTAMGDAINVASRLENAAAPGTIVVSENTARLIRHAFDLESLGGLELKGKAEPVQAYRVIKRKETPESARGIKGLYSPLVGREREFQLLKASIEALAGGRGQIVSIIGDAGLGKSRLLDEVRRTGQEESFTAPDVNWLEGRSLSYQTTTPYAPFVDLFGHLFGFAPEEKDLDKYDQVKSEIDRVLPGRADEVGPFIATLMGIELIEQDLERVKYLTPPDLRERIYRSVGQLLEAEAGQAPLVLVLEDLHWADASSLALLERLMPLAQQSKIALVALFRPQRQDPSWQFHEIASRDYQSWYTSIQLEPLDESSSRELVANLLEIEDLPPQVRALILKKAEGNPFYVEEVIRSLLDAKLVVRENSHWKATREIANIQVPDNLAAVITARLDRLDEDSKRTAQTAAVVGREFQFDILAEVAEAPESLDPALGTLETREIIREKESVPQREYLFKHAVTQETAYATILMSKRRELNRRVADCLERVDPERVNEIAWHLVEAKEDARALPYLIGAGERAARAYSIPEAIGYFTRAVEIAKAGDNISLARRAYEGLGGAQSFAFNIPVAISTYEEMDEWAKAHKDVPMQVSAINKLAYTLAFAAGQVPSADKYLQEAEKLASEVEDKPGLIESYFVRCGMCTAAGDFESVVYYMNRSADYGRDLNLHDQVAASLDHTSRSQLLMTRFDEAWRTAQEALAVSRRIKNRDLESLVLATIAALHVRNGDLEAAREAAQEGRDIALRIGSMIGGVAAPWALGAVLRAQGDYQGAIAAYQESVQHGYPLESFLAYMLAWPLASLGATYAEISPIYYPRVGEMHTHTAELLAKPTGMPVAGSAYLDIGMTALDQERLDDAADAFQKGLAYPSMYRQIFQPQLQVGLALVAVKRRQFDEAAKTLAEARAYAEERSMKNVYPLLDYAQAVIDEARGDSENALGQLGRAEMLATEMNMRPMVWQVRAAAAQLLTAMGRPEEAREKRKQAREAVDEIAGLMTDPEMRSAFVENAENKIGMVEGSRL